jgi:hypothetical protein
MHPVEHTFYFSCALLPLVFKLHPVLFLFNLLHAAISPMAGHDGLSGEVGGGEFIYSYLAQLTTTLYSIGSVDSGALVAER